MEYFQKSLYKWHASSESQKFWTQYPRIRQQKIEPNFKQLYPVHVFEFVGLAMAQVMKST
jgi:hypothetical protein